jgi:DNA-binding NarL/FixJ family response regulator
MTRACIGLTPTQQKVHDLIILGRSTKEIARELGRGLRTVEDHRHEIYRKMDVNNPVQLLRKALGLPLQ